MSVLPQVPSPGGRPHLGGGLHLHPRIPPRHRLAGEDVRQAAGMESALRIFIVDLYYSRFAIIILMYNIYLRFA